ncbi:MAG: tryptophan 7-halogenase [Brevundimonas sp.]|uniref:tryptophan halogenase family protein n=1 Tax=Brevundimonas sp. TaxID=1871086 RepID=UPI002736359B|nr:tryptophan halogenase family protein [Brevundimonas sp.]MDP3404170.1 tryptophan 7-halogenase [Brevundimonas sp.]
MRPPASVVIVGGGSAGWMTAAALSRAFGARLSVSVLEDPEAVHDTGTLAPFEATLPSLTAFNASLGLDEAALMAATNATFRLGTCFRDWTRRDRDYIHPFSEIGGVLEGVPFHHYWLRLKAAGKAPPLEAFALAAVAARAGRFSRPSNDPRSVTSTMAYGLHLQVVPYVAALKAGALARGVKAIAGTFADVERGSQGDTLAVVVTRDGRRFEADLFIDASGPAGDLIHRLGATRLDWSRWLPCDRIACSMTSGSPGAPLTEARAVRTGWLGRVPLQTGTGTARISASAFGGGPEEGTAFTNGRRSQTWIGNCIAIGLSATTLEPLEASGLHLVQSGVSKLLGLFPTGGPMTASAVEYNRLMAAEADRLRDLLILHYHANARAGEPLWDALRQTPPPEELAHKIRMFASRGRISLYDEETFEEPAWVSVFLGQNVIPRRYHPLADHRPLDEVQAQLERMRTVIARAAQAMPTHESVLSGSPLAPALSRVS